MAFPHDFSIFSSPVETPIANSRKRMPKCIPERHFAIVGGASMKLPDLQLKEGGLAVDASGRSETCVDD